MARKFSFFRRNPNRTKLDGANGECLAKHLRKNYGASEITRKTSLPNHIEKLENHGQKSEGFESRRRSSTKDEAVWYQYGKNVNR